MTIELKKMKKKYHLALIILLALLFVNCGNNMGILLYDMKCVPQSFDDMSMEATIRDFSSSHPDFESMGGATGVTTGLVQVDLGIDDKPVFNSTVGIDQLGNPITMLTSAAAFNQWYNTIDGVNFEFQDSFYFTNNNNMLEYVNTKFFPLTDADGYGNQGNSYNYHFTTEIHLEFTYMGGEIFTFEGDDDLWLFIDRKLVIDLGGVHGSSSKTVELDTLGLTIENDYTLDIFHAERHKNGSNFTIRTNVRKCINKLTM